MESKTIRVNGPKYFVTWPQCDEALSDHLACVQSFARKHNRKVACYLISSEKHQDGNMHRHAYFELDKAITNAVPQNSLDIGTHHPNIQGARSATKSLGYCAKDGNYISDLPDLVIKRAVESYKLAEKRKSTPKGEIYKKLESGEITLPTLVKHYPNEILNIDRWQKSLRIQRNLEKALETRDLEKLDNLWIYGPPGCGKSSWVSAAYPNRWIKPNNVWWGGYDGQMEVECQDVDVSWKSVIWDFKTWFDHYRFAGRVVASDPLTIRFARGIVTSNYSIRELVTLMELDEKLCRALERRFTQSRVQDLQPLNCLQDGPELEQDLNMDELSQTFMDKKFFDETE